MSDVCYADVLKISNLLGDDLGRAKREWAIDNIPWDKYDRRDRLGGYEPHPSGPWQDGVGAAFHEGVGYRTGSGNTMSLLVEAFPLNRADVPLLTEYEQVALCGDCKGSNGGCPGFAPRFDTMRKSESRITIITVSFDYIWSIMYATPKDGWVARRIIKQMVYADRLTENYCTRMLKHLKSDGMRVLSLGNCTKCKPKFCTVIRGEKCKFPKERTFSIEAVGVDCDALHERFYGECLPWYYKGTSRIPTYMTRYVGVFGQNALQHVRGLREFIGHDKSSVALSEVPEPRDASISLQKIPHGQHEGDFQYVYNDPGLV